MTDVPMNKIYDFYKPNKNLLMTVAIIGLTFLCIPEIHAQTDGLNPIVARVTTTLMPNFKFGTCIVSGILGICIAIGAALKSATRMAISGGAIAILPTALWDTVVGTAATVLIP